MPIIETKNQDKIIADFELLQELHRKWRSSITLANISPLNAVMYSVYNSPNNDSEGMVMWNGQYCALLSSKSCKDPYDFIATAMRDMDKNDIVVLFTDTDYEATMKCSNLINSKKLIVKFDED